MFLHLCKTYTYNLCCAGKLFGRKERNCYAVVRVDSLNVFAFYLLVFCVFTEAIQIKCSMGGEIQLSIFLLPYSHPDQAFLE